MIAPLRYVISLKRRSKITILAIGIVIMFITATSVIVYSFEISNKQLVEKFESRYYILYSNDNLLKSKVSLIKNLKSAYVYIIPAKIDNFNTYVVGIYDPSNLLGGYYQCLYNQILLGENFENEKVGESINLQVGGNLTQFLEISNIQKLKFFPEYWGIINYSLAQQLRNYPNFIITDKKVDFPGLHTSSMIRLNDFYFKSSEEVTTDLLFLAMISIVAIYFFINSLLTIEIRENTKKIAIIRALGSTTGNINAIYLLRSLYLGLAGMGLGVSIGIILAYLVAAIFPLFGVLTYFIIYIPFKIFTFPLIIVVGGALIGSIQPLRRVNKIRVVSGLKEVIR